MDYFPILQLTPDEPVEIKYYGQESSQYGYFDCTQDDLLEIMPLTPDITSVTDNNQLHCDIRLFFEEIGVLSEEPEPIDPNRDYEKEFQLEQDTLQAKRKTRQRRNANQASLNSLPSLAPSEVTSAASSAEPRKWWPQPHDMIYRRTCHMHEITHDMKDNTTGPLPGDLIEHASAYLYEETYR